MPAAPAPVASRRLHPAWLIPGGLPTEATAARVLVSKYADHLPLYRQVQIYSCQVIDLGRSTLADWVGRAAFELRPLHEALRADLKCPAKLFMDEDPRAGFRSGGPENHDRNLLGAGPR